MSKQQVVQIAKEKELQTKTQKEFNRLIKKIEKLETEIVEYRDGLDKVQVRVSKELLPLQKKLNEARADLVRSFDRACEQGNFKKTDRKKLEHLIVSMAFELINIGFDDLKVIYDKYSEQSFDEMNEAANAQTAQMMRQMSSMFGLDIDEDVDLTNEEEFEAYMAQKMADEEEKMAERQRKTEERRAAKPKSEKQMAKEEAKKAEEKSIAKTVRAIYMDLVKAFHPDRETDEAEKERKTEIMHRVTEAYESNNLLKLLKLQLEFNRIDQNHIEKIADEQLKYYNKVLKERAKELDEEMWELWEAASSFSSRSMYEIDSIFALNIALDQDIKQLKREAKEAEKDAKSFQDFDILQQFLKQYKIPRQRVSRGDLSILDLFMS